MKQNNSHEINPRQSVELLKELHILTRDGKLNQDSRRKLKQIYHLYQFIEPYLIEYSQVSKNLGTELTLVDHGAGKSYLGFILYDLFFKHLCDTQFALYSIESRNDLVDKSISLATKLGFKNMSFLNLSIDKSIDCAQIPKQIDIFTALHACDTATDDAISFAIAKKAKVIILVPCCQAEIAAILRANKTKLKNNVLSNLWQHPIHTREFGSHLTNVLRSLQLESMGYQVTVTELIGWEHSMKNELIIAKYNNRPNLQAQKKLVELLNMLGLEQMLTRFMINI